MITFALNKCNAGWKMGDGDVRQLSSRKVEEKLSKGTRKKKDSTNSPSIYVYYPFFLMIFS